MLSVRMYVCLTFSLSLSFFLFFFLFSTCMQWIREVVRTRHSCRSPDKRVVLPLCNYSSAVRTALKRIPVINETTSYFYKHDAYKDS